MHRKLALALALLVAVAAAVTAAAFAGNSGPAIPQRDTSGDTPGFTEDGGVTPLADANTIAHWAGSFTDPTNGQTYGFTMVGHAPSTNASSTPTDIIPLRVVFDANGGYALDGTSKVAAVEASPVFRSNDYSSVSNSSGGPGTLSPGNVGQLEDATMRSQFNKIGSGYHVLLGQPTVHPTITVKVPQGKGSAFVSSLHMIYGLVDSYWFTSQVKNVLGSSQIDASHLAIVLTDNVMLFDAKTGGGCCTIGYHGATNAVGNGGGSTSGNGKQQVQTYIFAAYSTPGVFSTAPYIADIHGLSHEVSEWADDPFYDNAVDPWLTPTGQQYGCTSVLETGDPVVGIGFNIGTNSFPANKLASGAANPYDDGTWHPEDEVFLPWFARTSPNTISEPTQSSSDGRYTFMGDLNPYAAFHQPATGC